jgi:hypothetical protein
MLTGIMEVTRADLGAHNEKIKLLQESVRADLTSRISQSQEANEKFQEILRAETKTKNEKLIKRFELKNQQTNKEFLARLDSESRRLSNLLGQVQKETESELVAVKRQLQVINTGFETTLEQSSTHTQGIIDELASQMVDHRSKVEATISKFDQDVSHRFTRQKESINETNQAVNHEQSATECQF